MNPTSSESAATPNSTSDDAGWFVSAVSRGSMFVAGMMIFAVWLMIGTPLWIFQMSRVIVAYSWSFLWSHLLGTREPPPTALRECAEVLPRGFANAINVAFGRYNPGHHSGAQSPRGRILPELLSFVMTIGAGIVFWKLATGAFVITVDGPSFKVAASTIESLSKHDVWFSIVLLATIAFVIYLLFRWISWIQKQGRKSEIQDGENVGH